jgi:hypothetical protein
MVVLEWALVVMIYAGNFLQAGRAILMQIRESKRIFMRLNH